MRQFDYIRPTTLQEATSFLEGHADDASVLAGGTAIVILLSQGIIRPQYVVDLAGIPELRGFQAGDSSGVRIGALTPIRTLELGSVIRENYGTLAESSARDLPGVVCVLTRDEVLANPAINPYFGYVFRDVPVVALDKVRHQGDIVVVVAEGVSIAEEALELI